MRSRSAAPLLALSLVTILTGCAQPEPIAKFSVTAMTVADWEGYRDKLQPKFGATADSMLASVLPVTVRSELKTVDQTAARFAVQVPASGSTPDTPDLPAAVQASSLPGIAQLGALGSDPLLQYHLANALFQEVQLLNGALKDAAIPDTYNAYVLRLNLAVMPFRSDQPADAYATISFFDGLEDANGKDVQTNLLPNTPVAPIDANHPHMGSNVHTRVIPMFVTDTIEAALRSQSRDQINDLAAALAAGTSTLGASASIASRVEQLASSLARDYNTTFQVFQDSENTILVKVGSVNAASSERALLGRTFPVSVLLLVPKRLFRCDGTHPRVDIVAALTLRDPVTGAQIATPSVESRLLSLLNSKFASLNNLSDNIKALGADAERHVNAQLKKSSVGPTTSELLSAHGVQLLLALDRNDYGTFRNVLRNYPDMAVFPHHIWPLLVEAINESGFSGTSVSLACPREATKATFVAAQDHAVLLDDGKSSIIDVNGFRNLPSPSKLSLRLKLFRQNHTLLLPASKVTVAENGESLRAQFPPLKQFGAHPASLEIEWITLGANGKPKSSSSDSSLAQSINLQYIEIKPNPEKPGYTLQTDARSVVRDDRGRATWTITLKRDPDKKPFPPGLKVIGVRIIPAVIDAATATPASATPAFDRGGSLVTFDATAVDLNKDIVLRLDLENLRAAQRVQAILLFEKEEAGSTLDIPTEGP